MRQRFGSRWQVNGSKARNSRSLSATPSRSACSRKSEAAELKALLEYRNDIAHRIYLVMSDISRNYWAIDHVAYAAPAYKGEALDRLRAFRRSLWERARGKFLLKFVDGQHVV